MLAGWRDFFCGGKRLVSKVFAGSRQTRGSDGEREYNARSGLFAYTVCLIADLGFWGFCIFTSPHLHISTFIRRTNIPHLPW